MNGIQNVTDKITSAALAAADEVVKEAEKNAAELAKKVEVEAAEKALALMNEAEKDCAEIHRRSLSVTDLDKRKMTLAAKRDILNETYEEIRKAVYDLPAAEYAAFLTKLILSSEGYSELIFAEKDKTVSKKILTALKNAGRSYSSVTYTDSIERGFILGEGAVRVDYSLDEILAANRAATEIRTAGELFAAEKGQ